MSQGDSSLPSATEAELVTASRGGNRKAFGELVTRHQDRVFNLAYRLTGDYEDASEAVQEAFLKAFKAVAAFRGESGFYTWLFRITVNVVRSRRRFRAVRPVERSLDADPRPDADGAGRSPAAELKADVPDPSDEAGRVERKELVEKALKKLEPEQRAMIVLRDIEGRSYSEIADVLDCPRGTVKSRLHRARLALRKLLASVLANPEDTGAYGRS